MRLLEFGRQSGRGSINRRRERHFSARCAASATPAIAPAWTWKRRSIGANRRDRVMLDRKRPGRVDRRLGHPGIGQIQCQIRDVETPAVGAGRPGRREQRSLDRAVPADASEIAAPGHDLGHGIAQIPPYLSNFIRYSPGLEHRITRKIRRLRYLTFDTYAFCLTDGLRWPVLLRQLRKLCGGTFVFLCC
jgi:hypothetical protein